MLFKQNEFTQRANEIIKIYDIHREFIIKNVIFDRKINYPFSKFYVVEFENAKELVTQITIMIGDAIKCFKKQNRFWRSKTENLLTDLEFIQKELIYIYIFRMK